MDHRVTKPRLATNLPAPKRLSPEEMEQATAEARALRARFDRATAGMESLQGNDERIRLK